MTYTKTWEWEFENVFYFLFLDSQVSSNNLKYILDIFFKWHGFKKYIINSTWYIFLDIKNYDFPGNESWNLRNIMIIVLL